ncbi:OpgC domain-containing protein [Bradyrhizobium cenepequi]|uniref:OpgC domain-containing protein n=1 Tax=Bradyrhizobium cenepequi TaxID=2821403 RepID=UPI00289AFC99|nr:OpgC domain-containing protein [Bradyrhizobium cenepequi]
MLVRTQLPPSERDLRLDLFRGLANSAIFLDHIVSPSVVEQSRQLRVWAGCAFSPGPWWPARSARSVLPS